MELFIAEKPSVGRAIADGLGGTQRAVRGNKGPTHILVGNDKVVTWCFGHILEQANPEDYDADLGSWSGSVAKLPIVPAEWKLKSIASSREQLGVIRDLLKDASVIIHAGDPDREGQLLVDEVLHFLKNKKPVQRILPNAIDDASIRKILGKRADNEDFRGQYEAAVGRSRADWLVGMNLTRAATVSNQRSGMRGVLSVGRVQTPTLAMIVARDLEIEHFKPQAFFGLGVHFKHAKGDYTGKWKPADKQPGLDKEGRLIDESIAKALAAKVSGKPGVVAEYKVEAAAQQPPLPFSLATLQAKASAAFGLGAKQVLDICQSLYETHKVASYPRTDCQFLPESQHAEAPSVLAAIRKFDPSIAALAQGASATRKSRVFNDKKVSAHHAIVPTGNANYSGLDANERKVFGLIVKFYLAQFYPDFTYKQTSVLTECAGEKFSSSGRTPVDYGWRKVFGVGPGAADDDDKDDDNQLLPSMAKSDPVQCTKAAADKKMTKPPAHYTEGTLIRAMTNVHEIVSDPEQKKKLKDVKGIGTEATRAAIIETLKKRQFVEIRKSQILSTDAGRSFIKALPAEVTDVAMTALWENKLDQVEERKLSLAGFTQEQALWAGQMVKRLLDTPITVGVGMKGASAEDIAATGAGGSCPACGKGTMQLRMAKKGPNAGKGFLGCSAYPNCNHTAKIDDDKQPAIQAQREERNARAAKATAGGGMRSPHRSLAVPMAPGVRGGKSRRGH